MQKRKLAGLDVSPMGMGCWAIGGPFWDGDNNPLGWGEVDDNESINAIHAGIEAGINFLDTADLYGAGHSERVIAKALTGKREQLIVATKFAFMFDEANKQAIGPNASPEYIHAACDASLKRLDTDYIDLLQFHWNDYPAEDAAEVRDTLEALVSAGKIRAYGWSTDFVDRAEAFAQGQNCAAIQFEYNLFNDNADMVAFCQQHDLASINRGPLAMGLLSGKHTHAEQLSEADIRRKNPEWLKYFNDGVPAPALVDKLNAIKEILNSEGRSNVQGALAWIWATSPNNIPIPGFRTVAQIEQNAAAMQFGPLRTEQLAEIDNLLKD